MTHITITEANNDPTQAVITFDGRTQLSISLSNPLSEAEQERLDWYFETYLSFPYTKHVIAEQAVASLKQYGQALFEQVFQGPSVSRHYAIATQRGLSDLRLEIVGSAEFQRYFWEALYDPDLKQFLAHQATFRRSAPGAIVTPIAPRPSPTINLLLVVARPSGRRDIGYRTISRPLVESLRQAQLPVQIDLVRPGSYEALVKHLEQTRQQKGAGYYHILHFDLHGAVMRYQQVEEKLEPSSAQTFRLYGREPVTPYEGERAFLFFEGADYQERLVQAESVAQLMQSHQVPLVILNACQAGKIGDDEASLAIRLHQAGVQTVVAMRYSLFVSTAKRFIPALYQQLVREGKIVQAMQWARQQLAHDKERAYTDRPIYFEDWLLPLLYQAGPEIALQPESFATPEAETRFYERHSLAWQETTFFGRDLELLELEKRLLGQGLVLLEGLGGQGKTSLLKHAANWWQLTDWIEGHFYFGYDEKAWRLAEILHTIAQTLYPNPAEMGRWLALPDPAKQARLVQALRGQRYLLILDNCESITGTYLAIQNTLTSAEQAELRQFLQQLRGGQSFILCGSRDEMAWLKLPPSARHPLGGLDAEATQTLVDHLLQQQGLPPYRDYIRDETVREDFRQLLKLLDGHPLALRVIISKLSQRTPSQIISALQAGQVAELDPPLIPPEGVTKGGPPDKTESILACIEYAYHDIDPTDQILLLCLAPFSGVVGGMFMEQYIEQLKAQPALADLLFERLPTLLQTAQQRGLLTPHDIPGYLRLQPIFPYFLRSRFLELDKDRDLQGEKTHLEGLQVAIETAFRHHYDGVGGALARLLKSKEASEKQAGFVLTKLEYENLRQALTLALSAQVSSFNTWHPLQLYLDATQDHARGLELGQMVLDQLTQYPAEALQGQLGQEFVGVVDDIASRYLELKQYAEAEAAYQRTLALVRTTNWGKNELQGRIKASVYHQLGIVAQEQRQFEQAEHYYQQALKIYIEFNDRYSQASSYHQLGSVAEEQRQFEQAEHYYQQALKIYIEFNDRYSQASIYHRLGGVAEAQRQFEQAEHYYQQALKIYIEFNDRYSQASTYHQLGSVAQAQRQFEQAEHYYQQALKIKIEFNDRYSQANTYHQLGMVAEAQRQFEQAEHYYQQALKIKIEFNDRYSQASSYHQLGSVAEAQRQFEQAEHYYQQALKIKIEFNDRYSQASTYHQLGSVAQEQRQFKQAVAYLLQDLEISAEYKDEHGIGITMRSLGRVLRAADDGALWAQVAEALGVSVDELRGEWDHSD